MTTLYNLSRYLLAAILVLIGIVIVWSDVVFLMSGGLKEELFDGVFYMMMLSSSVIMLSLVAVLVAALFTSKQPYRQLGMIVLPILFFVFFFFFLPDYLGFYEYHLESLKPGGADPLLLSAGLLVYFLVVIYLTQRLHRFLKKRFFGESFGRFCIVDREKSL